MMTPQYEISQIVVHCSDSPRFRGDDAATINRWHQERGWQMIGYHYVILGKGEIQNGRPEFIQGAHAKSHNAGTIGICLIGDDEPTVLQSVALAKLVKDIKERYQIDSIKGHYELDPRKSCPCFDVPAWVERMQCCWID